MSKPSWHFVSYSLRDGRPVPADGVTITHPGPAMTAVLTDAEIAAICAPLTQGAAQ